MTIKLLTTLAILFSFFVLPVRAGQPVVWETSGRTELLKGDSRGVSISDTGVLMLAPKLIQPLSWPALLVALVLCMQVYWLALLWRGRR